MKYIHLRKRANGIIKAKGGTTVAYEVNGSLVTFATAKCSKRDSYCKRTGRDIATGRWLRAFKAGLDERHSRVIVLGAGESPISAIVSVVRRVA
jgi:hypothetical protein